MGRFDALIQLEENQEKTTPPPAVYSPTPANTQSQPIKKPNEPEKKSTKPQVYKTTSIPSPLNSLERPEKYTTHLEPSMIRKLKLHAAETEMKDYQVVQKALLLYFEKFEKNK
jgi:hypothetical protein